MNSGRSAMSMALPEGLSHDWREPSLKPPFSVSLGRVHILQLMSHLLEYSVSKAFTGY